MADREKVIKGLTCCRKGFCFACPYNDGVDSNVDCKQKWADDCLELLKEQEPRVLTLNEVEDKLDDVVWMEEPGCENLSANFAVIAAYSTKYNKVYAYFFSTRKKEFEYGEYNKTWRCWSAKPSDAERKAVAWND